MPNMTGLTRHKYKGEDAMEIRPIKTESDYQATLAEVERLFEALPDTPEGDRLEVLTTLLEAYEKIIIPSRHPIR